MRDSLPETTLNALRWQFAALDVEAKLVRARLALKVFNPLQPRVPAGTREGGRWAGDGSLIQPAAGRERDRISGAELAEDPYLNRHIVDGHIGKTDAEMIERVAESYRRKLFGLLPPITPLIRDGSFESIESARTFIRDTLDKNEDAVQRVAEGSKKGALLKSRFGYPTGREAVSIPKDTPIRMRTTYGVGVLIVHDLTAARGLRIITAYPRNDDDEDENKSDTFTYVGDFTMKSHWKEFCWQFHQDCDILGDSWDEIVAFVISYGSREDALKIRDFLDDLLSKNLSDQELMDIWMQSPADTYISDKEVYRFFYKMIRDTADRHVQGQLPQSPLPDV